MRIRRLVALILALGGMLPHVAAAATYPVVQIIDPVTGASVTDGSGNLKVTGSLTATTTFPYNVTNGQTVTTASAIAVGALDGNGKFSPLKEDTSQNLDVNCIAGCASLSFPYNVTNGQTVTTASAIAVGALDANGKFSPLQEDASQNLLIKPSCYNAGTLQTNIAGCWIGLVVTDNNGTTSSLTSAKNVDSAQTNTMLAVDVCDAVSGKCTQNDASGNVKTNVNAWGLGSTTTLGKVTDLLPYGGTSDAQTATTVSGTLNMLYNGTTVDRWRSTSASNPGVGEVGICDPTSAGRCLGIDASGIATVKFSTGQSVSCTAGTCAVNVGQFGGTNVVTGTGAGGSGIPRITVSNDSAVNQSTGTAGYSYLLDSAGTNKAQVDANGFLYARGKIATNYTNIPAGTGNTVATNAAGRYYGVIGLGTGAGVIGCFDNATTNSGQLVYNNNVGPSTIEMIPGGVPLTNGLTCAGATGSAQALVIWSPNTATTP